jgi:SmpA / OmlA family
MLKFATIFFSALVLFVGIAWWWLWCVPFSEATIQKVVPGMSESQVFSVLGTAGQTNRTGGGETLWIYSHKPSIRCLMVTFDESNRVESCVID